MPCVASIELVGRCNIQKQISQRRLQSIKGKIQEIKCDYGNYNGSVGDLSLSLIAVERPKAGVTYQLIALGIPITCTPTGEIDKEGSHALTKG